MRRHRRRSASLVVSAAVAALSAVVVAVRLQDHAASSAGRNAAATVAASPSAKSAPYEQPVVSHRVSDVVALGDSVPAGSECGCIAYPALVAQRLAARERQPVRVNNLARPGLTTQGLIAQLTQPGTRRAVNGADLVIVTIGANDLENLAGASNCDPAVSTDCFSAPLAQLPARYDQMLDEVHSLLHGPQAQVVVTGYWNVFLDGAVARRHGQAYVDNSRALTAKVNSVIAWSAVTHDSDYVDIDTPFSGDSGDDTALLAADGDHPNALGHRVIADAIDSGIGLDT